jgi:hypothetical protein
MCVQVYQKYAGKGKRKCDENNRCTLVNCCAHFVIPTLDVDLHIEIDYSQLRYPCKKPEPHL